MARMKESVCHLFPSFLLRVPLTYHHEGKALVITHRTGPNEFVIVGGVKPEPYPRHKRGNPQIEWPKVGLNANFHHRPSVIYPARLCRGASLKCVYCRPRRAVKAMEPVARRYTLPKKSTNGNYQRRARIRIRRKIQFFARALDRAVIIGRTRCLATVQVCLAEPLRRTIAVEEYMPIFVQRR